MKLWLDDVRTMPSEYDFHAKTAKEAISILSKNIVEFISFDHDLGYNGEGTEENGATVAHFIEQEVFHGNINMPQWKIHSANPVGVMNIERAKKSAERFRKRNEDQ